MNANDIGESGFGSVGSKIDVPAEVALRAVEWLIELQSDEANAETHRSLHIWRAQHPDHERAWLHIQSVKERLRGAAGASGIAHATLGQPDSPNRRHIIKVLAILLFTGGVGWQLTRQPYVREWIASERTRIGERRTMTLADGTMLALNTSTAIDLRFTDEQRALELVCGEMLVTTSKDVSASGKPRPFLIETKHGILRPFGTRFCVRDQTNSCRIDVFEGAVAVDLRHPLPGRPRGQIVRAGESMQFTSNILGEMQLAKDTDVAWVNGMLVAGGMRLDDFLEELGRYRPGRLSCDPSIAHLRVSGTYPLDDTDKILELLQVTLSVKVHVLTRYWITVRPANLAS